MQSSVFRGRFVVFLGAALLSAAAMAASPAHTPVEGPVPGRYIVVLQDDAVGAPAGEGDAAARVAEFANDLARVFALRVERTWGHALNGFVAEGLSAAEAERLARHPAVAYVEQDYQAPALSAPSQCYSGATFPVDSRPLPSPSSNSSQMISCSNPTGTCIDNWGLDRSDQRYLPRDAFYGWGYPGRIKIYVIDTGIDYHREFQDTLSMPTVITSFGVDFTTDGVVTDCHGHGTHVAGIIGGRTYGVAKQASFIPVKFVECDGDGFASWLVSSFDYVRQHVAQYGWRAVANLSGGNVSTWVSMSSVQSAAQNLIASGVQLVQAAGNKNRDACTYSLGGTTDTLVVGAIDHNDGRLFTNSSVASNFGSCVDIWAPGGLITSAAFQTGDGSLYAAPYCELTGTSMAAPHVTGALARYLDANRSLTPSQLRSLVINDATTGVLSGLGTGSPNRLLYLP